MQRIREELVRLEDNIIIFLFNRTQFKLNEKIYTPRAIEIPDVDEIFLDFLFKCTEKIHASARRYVERKVYVLSGIFLLA